MDAAPRTLDIVSDAICPWCWIGRAHLQAALAELRAEGLEFRIRWRPFQLNPDMPPGGAGRDAFRARKFGSIERARQADAMVTQAGRAAGLAFRLDLVARIPNTLDAHRLLRAAEAAGTGVQDAVAEALFRAFFAEGRDIGDRATLAELAGGAGMDAAAVAAMLGGEAHRAEVLAEDAAVRQAGLSSVPSFLMDRHLLFSGALPPGRMAETFRRAHAALSARAA